MDGPSAWCAASRACCSGDLPRTRRSAHPYTPVRAFHELRNALTGVYGWAERLVRGKSPEQHARAAREVYEGAEHTISLLNNFLDLARLDAGKVRPVWHDVEIAAAV